MTPTTEQPIRDGVAPMAAGQSLQGSSAAPTAAGRILALDFTKGVLVMFMVLYHWLDYFYGSQHDIYRYLRFLSPSFIFITGFLVSQVYLPKRRLGDRRSSRRLMQRGLKIMILFTALNSLIALLTPDPAGALAAFFSPHALLAVYVTGNTPVVGVGKAAAFQILVPISLLLMLSSVVLIGSQSARYIFHAACSVSLLGIFALYQVGLESANLEAVSMGLLGTVAGYAPILRLDKTTNHHFALIAAYAGYLAAITVWNVRYPLQIVGVCLTLVLIYLVGTRSRRPAFLINHIVLLGKYSLFAYIAQIAIVRGLHYTFGRHAAGDGVGLLSFVGAAGLTAISVEGMNLARRKAVLIDKFYRVSFG